MERRDLLLMVCTRADGTVNRERFSALCNKWSPEARAASLAARIAKYGSGFSPAARAARGLRSAVSSGVQSTVPVQTRANDVVRRVGVDPFADPHGNAPGVIDEATLARGWGVGVEPHEDGWFKSPEIEVQSARYRYSMAPDGFWSLGDADQKILFKDALHKLANGENLDKRDKDILDHFEEYNARRMAEFRVNSGDPLVLSAAAFAARNKGVGPKTAEEWAQAESLAGFEKGTLEEREKPLGYRPSPYTTASTDRARQKGYELFVYQEDRFPSSAADWDRVDTLGAVPRDEWWDTPGAGGTLSPDEVSELEDQKKDLESSTRVVSKRMLNPGEWAYVDSKGKVYRDIGNRWSENARAASLAARMEKYGSGFSPAARAAAALSKAGRAMKGDSVSTGGQKDGKTNGGRGNEAGGPSMMKRAEDGDNVVVKPFEVIKSYDGYVYQYDHLGNLQRVGKAGVIRPGTDGNWEIRPKGTEEWVSVPAGSRIVTDGKGRRMISMPDGYAVDLTTGDRVPGAVGLMGAEGWKYSGDRVPGAPGLMGVGVSKYSPEFYERVGDFSAVRDFARLTFDYGHLNPVRRRNVGA